jgi:hypothetical protein
MGKILGAVSDMRVQVEIAYRCRENAVGCSGYIAFK